MTDQQWKRLQDDLKSIAPDQIDGPADPTRFKERVLQEYERRNRQEHRGRWIRRAATGLTAAAAVWAAVTFTGPMQELTGIDPFSSSAPKSTKEEQAASEKAMMVAPAQMLTQFVDLTINGKEAEAKSMLSSSLQGTTWLQQPSNKAHITGFSYKEISTGGEEQRYQVTVNWATYDTQTRLQNFEIALAKSNSRWQITEIEPRGESVVFEQSGTVALERGVGKTETMFKRNEVAEQGELTMFASNPSRVTEMVFAVRGNETALYRMDADSNPRLSKLTSLAEGEVGEMFWVGGEVLAVNFTPQVNRSAHQMLFLDAKTGKPLNHDWLGQHLKQLGLEDVHVIHSLPENKLRVRSGAVTMIADLTNRTLSTDAIGGAPHMQSVKYDKQGVSGLPDRELRLDYPDQNPQWPEQYNIPEAKRLDLTQEAGLYVSNGSVESFSIVGNELHIELHHEPGRVQILAVPYSVISLATGQEVLIKIFDEQGNVIGVPRSIRMP